MMWIGLRTQIGSLRMRRHAFLELILPPAALAGADRDVLAARLALLFGRDLGVQPAIVRAQLAALRQSDATPRLAELKGLPTLVMSAEHDPIAPPRLGWALADGIPGSLYRELTGASHGAPLEAADRVNAILLEHFARADRIG
jgi:pimeloyl-ACP methyl ester carboxylesterase